MLSLRRERIGEFNVADAWQLSELVATAQAATDAEAQRLGHTDLPPP